MKKRIHVYLSFIIFLLFFLCLEVSASTTCVYKWNNESILLKKEDSSDYFDKIEANIKISIADGNLIWANQNGTCPTVSFYHGLLVGNKIFASQDLCRGTSVSPDDCTEDLEGEKLDNQSEENALGKSQVVLVDKGENFCSYKSNDYEFYISNGSSSFHPNYSCQLNKDENLRCQLDSDGDKAYFHGSGTSGSFICPQYLYYECVLVSQPGRHVCKIIGSGGSGDTNISGINSSAKGDEPSSGSGNKPGSGGDTTIETGPLDCDGIFSGDFGIFLQEAWKLIKFVVPILVIGLAIVDFLKAMSSHDEAEVKKASGKLVKRLVIGVLIFVLPTVIELLLQWAGIEYGTCNIR